MAKLFPIENVGSGGIITDIEPYQLQPNEWSGGVNIEFQHGAVTKIKGYAEVMEGCPIDVWHLGTYQEHSHAGKIERDGFYWIAFGMKKIYVYHNDTWTNITRIVSGSDPVEDDDYNTYEGTNWKVTTSGALLLATNGVDVPQVWELSDTNRATVNNRMKNLDNWPINDLAGTGSNSEETQENCLHCETLVGFRSILIASNIMKHIGVKDELQNRVVKWSQPHSHYDPPTTWDPFDDKADCGEYELLETQGPIVDTLAMQELFMVYKTDSIYMMSYIGTPYIFAFKTLHPEIGLLTKGAVCNFPGGHFFVSNSDCYVNNGQTVIPILTGKVRGELFNDLNGLSYDRLFCVTDEVKNQVMVCYPGADHDYCNKAMIWNYKDNTFSFRTLPHITDIKKGIKQSYTTADKDIADLTWTAPNSVDQCMPERVEPLWEVVGPETVCVSWDSDFDLRWGGISYENVVHHLVYCAPGDAEGTRRLYRDMHTIKSAIYRDSVGELEDGKTMYSYVERTGIDLGDPSAVKSITAIWPKIRTQGSTVMNVYVGWQMATDEAIHWEGPYRYNPNGQSKISVRVTGKLLGIRFETEEDTDWSISGIEFEIASVGRRGGRVYV